MHHGLGIRTRADADVIAFDGANEGFSHSIALRTLDRRRSWFRADVASEAAGIASNVAAAIVGKPFDGDRYAIDLPNHAQQQAQGHAIRAGNAAGRGKEAHGFAIRAIKGEGDPHSLAAVASDLEAVGAPGSIVFIKSR